MPQLPMILLPTSATSSAFGLELSTEKRSTRFWCMASRSWRSASSSAGGPKRFCAQSSESGWKIRDGSSSPPLARRTRTPVGATAP